MTDRLKKALGKLDAVGYEMAGIEVWIDALEPYDIEAIECAVDALIRKGVYKKIVPADLITQIEGTKAEQTAMARSLAETCWKVVEHTLRRWGKMDSERRPLPTHEELVTRVGAYAAWVLGSGAEAWRLAQDLASYPERWPYERDHFIKECIADWTGPSATIPKLQSALSKMRELHRQQLVGKKRDEALSAGAGQAEPSEEYREMRQRLLTGFSGENPPQGSDEAEKTPQNGSERSEPDTRTREEIIAAIPKEYRDEVLAAQARWDAAKKEAEAEA